MINTNLLIQGENLEAMAYLINDRQLESKIDLVYIDPPFATGGVFSVSDGRAATISNARNGCIAYDDSMVGNEYLYYLRQRLEKIHRLLSPRGSIYLHIDYKIGHYVKVLMDEVFGQDNFRNDITRIKCNPKNFKRIGYGNVKDMILFYTKSSNPIWNEPYQPYSDDDLLKLYPKISSDGRRYTTVPLHAPGETQNGDSNGTFKGMKPPIGRHWRTKIELLEKWDNEGLIEWSTNGNPRKKIYADEQAGKRIQDIWEFKDPQYPKYPTEKNLDMLNLIIKTSSDKDSIVLDCFCGSGSSLLAAEINQRKWIGIDQSEQAIQASQEKLSPYQYELFSDQKRFELVYLPVSMNQNEEVVKYKIAHI